MRYHLGKLGKWIDGHTFQKTSRLTVSRFRSFADFMSRGSIMDTYAAAIDAGGDAFEFWESVDNQRDVVEVRWMRMDHMLDAFRAQANRRHTEAEAKEMGEKGPRGFTETL